MTAQAARHLALLSPCCAEHVLSCSLHYYVVASLLRVIMLAIADVVGKPPTESVFFEKYARICVVIDEVINEVRPSMELGHCGNSMHRGKTNSFIGLQLLP